MQVPVNTFKQALAENRTQIGLWVALADAYSTELIAGIGFDWLLLDGEHAPNDVRSILAQLQAVASAQQAFGDARSHPVARVPLGTGEAGTAIIKQFLDTGVQTLLVPMVDTPEQAAQVVAAAKYPPEGVRGMGSALARASRWQTHATYVHEANDQICVLVQAETVTALNNLEAICAVDGVHGVFIGPADLAASMGHRGNPGHPEVQAAIEGAMKTIIASGKAAGTLTSDPVLAQRYLDLGCTFVAVGVDVLMFANAARKLRGQFAGAHAAAAPSKAGAAY